MAREKRNAAKSGAASTGASKRKSPSSKVKRPISTAKRGAAPTRPVVVPSQVVLHLETKDIPLRTADAGRTGDEGINFPRAAMQWTYVVRSRQRWSSTQHTVDAQAEAATQLMQQLGVSSIELADIARAGMVEVSVPWGEEAKNWAERIFPWEYVIAGATRNLRRGQPLTVTRHLNCGESLARRRQAERVLFVLSEPGPLKDRYDFERERALVRKNLKLARGWTESNWNDRNWKALDSPTAEELGGAIADFRPDIVHLAGFDTHHAQILLAQSDNQAERTIDYWDRETSDRPQKLKDGFVLASQRRGLHALGAEELGRLLVGLHRPQLVSMNFGNSAARLAPLTLAAGAHTVIGFQDSFDDDLAELFFALFYTHLEQTGWNTGLAFRLAWERVRGEPAHRQGTGIVLWSRETLVTRTGAAAQSEKVLAARLSQTEKPLVSTAVRSTDIADLVTVDVKPFADINYSVLHNRRRLFDVFSLKCQRPLRDVAIKVSLNVGSEAAAYECMLNSKAPAEDIKGRVHLPLTAALARTIQESILSSVLVEVTWGAHVLFRNTLPVRLTPVDQWRDNEADGRWLPSFVFPRDPTVSQIVETAQRYVRILRDDPNAGFDGYQSFDARAADPSEEVDLQVQAIWSAIVHELRLGYINPPPAYSNELDSQRLRTPSMVAKYRSGTCIDLALFFAACLELIDIYPVIFLLEGHAFPGYWRAEAYLDEFRQARPDHIGADGTVVNGSNSGAVAQRDPWLVDKESYREVVQYVNAGKLVPLESVRLTESSGFWDAVEAGRENLASRREFHSMIDIALARKKQVTPLPILSERS